LVVKDNGVGMDEEIVSHYFSRIGRSYHVETQNNRAIGQFGIGVFSYFMLNSVFTVETRKNGSEPLKFRVDQNAPELHYFFDEPVIGPGTTISFEAIKYDITVFELKEFLSQTFKLTSIPIFLNGEWVNQSQEYDFSNKEWFVTNYVKSENQQHFLQSYDLVIEHFKNDDFVGWVGAFIRKSNGFEDIRRMVKNSLGYYNKGVLVNHGSSFIGELNFTKGLPLNLNRNGFEQSTQLHTLHQQIIWTMYLRAFSQKVLAPAFLTHFFVFNFWGGRREELDFQKIEHYLYPFVFNKGLPLQVSLGEIVERKVDVELVESTTDLIRDAMQVSKTSSSYVISVMQLFTDRFYMNYFDHKGYFKSILNLDGPRLHFTLTKHPRSLKLDGLAINQCEFIEFQDDTLCSQFSHITYFNIRHELCSYLLEISLDKSRIGISKRLKELLTDLGSIMLNAFGRMIAGVPYRSAVVLNLNARLHEINTMAGTAFRIQKESFPGWMHPYIS
jgi:hypothetical protein